MFDEKQTFVCKFSRSVVILVRFFDLLNVYAHELIDEFNNLIPVVFVFLVIIIVVVSAGSVISLPKYVHLNYFFVESVDNCLRIAAHTDTVFAETHAVPEGTL